MESETEREVEVEGTCQFIVPHILNTTVDIEERENCPQVCCGGGCVCGGEGG